MLFFLLILDVFPLSCVIYCCALISLLNWTQLKNMLTSLGSLNTSCLTDLFYSIRKGEKPRSYSCNNWFTDVQNCTVCRVLRRIFLTGGGASQHECMKPSSVVYLMRRPKKNKQKKTKTPVCIHMLSIQKRPKKKKKKKKKVGFPTSNGWRIFLNGWQPATR